MLIVRAPVRLSLAGGGTDLEAYYARRAGMIVSVTLDKYFYVLVTPTDDGSVQIASSDFSAFFRHRGGRTGMWDGDLALPRAILSLFGVDRGYHLFLASEIPPGTGLGSSSAVAVALIKALTTLTSRPMSRAEIAEAACTVEIDQLGAPIGRQDQYAAAFGGLNAITFTRGAITVEPLTLGPEVRRALESNLLLFFTGASRKASSILSEQRRATEQQAATVARLDRIRTHAVEMRLALERGDLDRVGDILDRSWQEKRGLARGVTNDRIDRLYALARQHGARGGKITGAGGGGFLLLYCDDPVRDGVTEVLEAEGLYRMDFRFETGGARVLVNNITGPGYAPPGRVAGLHRTVPRNALSSEQVAG